MSTVCFCLFCSLCSTHRLNLVLSQAVSFVSQVKVFFPMLVILVHFQVAAPIQQASSWPTRSRFLVQVKPGATIELIPLMSFLKIASNFMIFWRRLMTIPSGLDDSIGLIVV